MIEVHVTVEVDRPPSVVFEFLADMSNVTRTVTPNNKAEFSTQPAGNTRYVKSC